MARKDKSKKTLMHYDVNSVTTDVIKPACGIDLINTKKYNHYYTDSYDMSDFAVEPNLGDEDEVWCKRCVKTKIFKQDQYLYEIGCDGDFKLFIQQKDQRK